MRETGPEETANAVGAGLLGSVSPLANYWSLSLTLGAIFGLTFGDSSRIIDVLLALSLVCGLLQTLYAMRCLFDAALFERLGDEPARFAELDRLLERLRLRAGRAEPRGVEERLGGALRLLKLQLLAAAVQTVAFFAGNLVERF